MKSDYRRKYCTWASNDINNNDNENDNPNILFNLNAVSQLLNQKKTALRKPSLAFVLANIPYNVVEIPYFKYLMACRRPSFVAPSRFLLQKEVEAVFLDAPSAAMICHWPNSL